VPILGPGDIELLQNISKYKNLTDAAKECGFSYKYAWLKLKKMGKKTGQSIVIPKRGGSGGGGAEEITPWGHYLIEAYLQTQSKVQHFMEQINHELEQKIYKHLT
jgi:molybdate transport system regulatory protein